MGASNLARFAAHVFDGRTAPRPEAPPSTGAIILDRAAWPDFTSPLVFTLGKGGVGKTTLSSAAAFRAARAHLTARVSICSTDPAPSLSDIFEQELGNEPQRVLRQKNLYAAEFNAVAEFHAWAARMKEKIELSFSTETRGVHVDLSFERQVFSALLDITPPGVDELFAIFRILELTSATRESRAQAIIDMAPTGHALELLRMPERMLHWSRLLLKILARHRDLAIAQDVAVEVAQIGHNARELATMLKSRARASVVPVMLAEPLPDRETRRLLCELRELGIEPQVLFVNRVLIHDDSAHCARCRIARSWQMATLARLAQRLDFRGELLLAPNFPRELRGRGGLQSVTRELWQPADPARQNKRGVRARRNPRNRAPKNRHRR
jgi:arsenite-transporting ATPase